MKDNRARINPRHLEAQQALAPERCAEACRAVEDILRSAQALSGLSIRLIFDLFSSTSPIIVSRTGIGFPLPHSDEPKTAPNERPWVTS
jgi:hypothetical protein